jgi:hypothetical protein
VSWKCQRAPTFRRAFDRLPPARQEKAREKFLIFRENPFDPKLGAHQIKKLSARYRQTVFGIHIESDLVATFLVSGEQHVTSLDIGDHSIYD